MRHLTLVRHAHAERLQPGLEDFERRLDERGRRDAARMAARAAERGLVPDHVVASPADRASGTAREFARALGFPLPRIRHDDRVYLASPDMLLAVLRGAPPTAHHVLLVGHNPGLSELVAWLTGEDSCEELPTAAVCALRAPLTRWQDLSRGQLERIDYLQP